MRNIFLAILLAFSFTASAQIPSWYDLDNIDIRRNASTINTFGADSSVSYVILNRDTNGIASSCLFIGDSARYYRCTHVSATATWVTTNVPNIGPVPDAFSMTYAEVSDSASAGALVPLATYNITDKSIYIQAITDSTFAIECIEVDSTLWLAFDSKYDFDNNHIFERCDEYGNCVGAAFTYIDAGLLTVDPITVFIWGDPFVQGNTVKNAVFDISGLGAPYYFIRDNYFTALSEVTISNSDSLSFADNSAINGVVWTATNVSGTIINNGWRDLITITMDSASGLIQQNNMYGEGMYFDISGSSGNFIANDGQGHLQARQAIDCNIRNNNFFNGAYIYADSLLSDINANELHRGSELHMVKSDSAFSKNYFDFTAIVKADSTHNRTEYNRFIGGGNGFGTVFNVRMSTSGGFNNNVVYSSGDTMNYSPTTVYNNIFDLGNRTLETAYGEMGFGDSTRLIAITQNVFSVVTNSNNTLWQSAAIDTHNVTYSGDSLIITQSGTYQINAQLSVDGTNGSIIRLGVFVNGSLACTCTGYQGLANNHIIQISYINIDTLTAGDVIQIVITNTASNDDVTAVGGKITVNKVR